MNDCRVSWRGDEGSRGRTTFKAAHRAITDYPSRGTIGTPGSGDEFGMGDATKRLALGVPTNRARAGRVNGILCSSGHESVRARKPGARVQGPWDGWETVMQWRAIAQRLIPPAIETCDWRYYSLAVEMGWAARYMGCWYHRRSMHPVGRNQDTCTLSMAARDDK
jgi:hypothetical protein